MRTLAELLKRRAFDEGFSERRFLLFEDEAYTWRETWEQAACYARAFIRLRAHLSDPLHVGILMENRPEFIFALLGCALSGAVMVGLNTTRRGRALARDIGHCDCRILLTESKFLDQVTAIRDDLTQVGEDGILVCDRGGDTVAPRVGFLADLLAKLRAEAGEDFLREPDVAVRPEDWWMIIFTSGSTGDPKAILISHRKALRAAGAFSDLGFSERDVFYAAMPLFHSNSLGQAFLPALAHGGTLALARRFSAGRFLPDVRRYGVTVFNYVGKPLAYILHTPELPDDADNPLRAATGAGATALQQEQFQRRFGLDRLVEMFGSTEAGASTTRAPGDPRESQGAMPPELKIFNDRGEECPPAAVDEAGTILNYGEAVGEIVNVGGAGDFEGYYKNPEATAEKTRGGIFRSGDLAYYRVLEKDGAPKRFLYYVGRTDDWIRKDGENFLAGPVEEILLRHDDVVLCSVCGVLCAHGDELVMAAIVLREGADFQPRAFYEFLTSHPDMSPKWVPDYIRLAPSLPQTETLKVLRGSLKRDGFLPGRVRDPVYWRERGDTRYKPFTEGDCARVREEFVKAGRPELLREE